MAVNTYRQVHSCQLKKEFLLSSFLRSPLLWCRLWVEVEQGENAEVCVHDSIYQGHITAEKFRKASDKPGHVCWWHSTETFQHFHWLYSLVLTAGWTFKIWLWFMFHSYEVSCFVFFFHKFAVGVCIWSAFKLLLCFQGHMHHVLSYRGRSVHKSKALFKIMIIYHIL